jgi:glycosyltransferase involved in cell wall biosynthesis
MRRKGNILILGYNPIPAPGYETVEGSGLRTWYTALVLQARGFENITIAISHRFPQSEQQLGGINVLNYHADETYAWINEYDCVIVNAALGDITPRVIASAADSMTVIVDALSPMYVEYMASSLLPGADKQSRESYFDKTNDMNQALLRADYILVANDEQKHLYRGVLAGLGSLLDTDDSRFILFPAYIPQAVSGRTGKNARRKDTRFSLLWFGGLYPWYDIMDLIGAFHDKRIGSVARLTVVGGSNPFYPKDDLRFNGQYIAAVKQAEKLGLTKDKTVTFTDWVPYKDRIKVFHDHDVAISISKPSPENEYSFRIGVADLAGNGLPILTNGTDYLGKQLIKKGVAFLIDTSSPSSLESSLLKVVDVRESIREAGLKLKDSLYDELHLDLYVDDLVSAIELGVGQTKSSRHINTPYTSALNLGVIERVATRFSKLHGPIYDDQQYDVSVNIVAHKEGVLLYKTLRSINIAIDRAIAKDINVEVNISLDKTDDETRAIAEEFCKKKKYDINLYEIEVGDLGKNRNFLISKSHGKYISFFDADDFFTSNYIFKAFELAETSDTPAVYVAKHIINFEGDHYLTKVLDSTDPAISKRFFFETNYYISQNFVHREIYESVQYHPNIGGYGFEDWHFNCEVLSKGYNFITVPDTIFYYRRKKNGSMLVNQVANSVVIRKTELFSRSTFLGLQGKEDTPQSQPVRLAVGARLKSRLHRHTLLYHYIKTTWLLNSGTVRALMRRYAGYGILRTTTKKDGQNELSILQKIDQNKKMVPARLDQFGLTRESIDEWGLLNAIEPMIRPSWDMLEYIPLVEYPMESRMSDSYYRICQQMTHNAYTDIMLIPHMSRGGAELATLHLLRTFASVDRKVLVIATHDSESPWAGKVREIVGVDFIESREVFASDLDMDRRMLCILKLIQAITPSTLTIVNSLLGYRLVARYKQVLKDMKSRVYVHTYAYDITEEGYLFNYIQNGLVDLHGVVAKYITDSAVYKKQLMDINGFHDDEVTPLYLPINPQVQEKRKYEKTKKIIYAARICNQKIADVAVRTGIELAKHGIELHFYGNIDPEYAEDDKFLRLIKNHPTIHYRGVFEGFESLPLDEYDMFLLTTRTEGMANVILEACKANIFIVSAAVGGLTECIREGENGILLNDEDKFSPEKYAAAILHGYQDDRYANVVSISKANNVVLKRHSLSAYEKTVIKTMELLP